jgi:hypothetical protein
MVLKNYLGRFAQKKTLGQDSAFGQELAGSGKLPVDIRFGIFVL